MNSKLKSMDLDLKEEFLVHLVFASLPKEFAPFVVNYNMQPEKVEYGKDNWHVCARGR